MWDAVLVITHHRPNSRNEELLAAGTQRIRTGPGFFVMVSERRNITLLNLQCLNGTKLR